jgi:hypothetical protein
MKRLMIVALSVAVAIAFGAVAAFSAGGQSAAPPAGEPIAAAGQSAQPAGERIAAAEQAFPVLASKSAAAAPQQLPTIAKRPNIVAEGRTGGPDPVGLTLTDSAELCVEHASTASCSSAADASATGIFVAVVDCPDGKLDVTLTGVLPAGVTSVSVADQSVTPDADGAVTVHVVDRDIDGLRLSNGQVSPWNLTAANMCESKVTTVPVSPVDAG